jgi:hypothetical protein
MRISKEEVLAAYEENNLVPIMGHIIPISRYKHSTNRECCGLGALATAAGIAEDRGLRYLWADETYGKKYAAGFMHGFDGVLDNPTWYVIEEYRNGLDDGKMASQYVFDIYG